MEGRQVMWRIFFICLYVTLGHASDIHKAIADKDEKQVASILKQADVTQLLQYDNAYHIAYEAAIYNGDHRIAQLLKNCINRVDRFRETYLHKALLNSNVTPSCCYDQGDFVDRLLRAGCQPSIQNQHGTSPLALAIQKHEYHIARRIHEEPRSRRQIRRNELSPCEERVRALQDIVQQNHPHALLAEYQETWRSLVSYLNAYAPLATLQRIGVIFASYFIRLQESMSQTLHRYLRKETRGSLLSKLLEDDNVDSIEAYISTFQGTYMADFKNMCVASWLIKRRAYNILRYFGSTLSSHDKHMLLSQVDESGKTPIHVACITRDANALDLLLYYLDDVTCVREKGSNDISPLSCIYDNCNDIFTTLISYGARVDGEYARRFYKAPHFILGLDQDMSSPMYGYYDKTVHDTIICLYQAGHITIDKSIQSYCNVKHQDMSSAKRRYDAYTPISYIDVAKDFAKCGTSPTTYGFSHCLEQARISDNEAHKSIIIDVIHGAYHTWPQGEEHDTIIDEDGMTPLIWATCQSHKQLAGDIIQHHTNYLDHRDKHGKSALIWAAQSGQKDIVDAICKRGANVWLRDNKGHTALSYASRNGYPGIVALLKDIMEREHVRRQKDMQQQQAQDNYESEELQARIKRSQYILQENLTRAIEQAAAYGHIETLAMLLTQRCIQ